MKIDWFVACKVAYPRPGQQGTGLWPASVAHAKRLGGTSAACGELTTTMKKLFEVPFPFAGENCRACLVAVSEERRARTQGARHVAVREGSA
ncbi:hypothetical protein J2X46_003274 [Nocardioides sp. BE266]|uniref:hypothetical protein n=1 Tax=Nocardioides sp. BE266 TaxID=2817725 RepID=UPI00286782FE|nr:hypothetical protein [Nocardioides sp. BE266]MDR7254281.1 hypothetical protein [Nocardioides sp. BE266]